MDILKTTIVVEAKYCFIYFMTVLPFCYSWSHYDSWYLKPELYHLICLCLQPDRQLLWLPITWTTEQVKTTKVITHTRGSQPQKLGAHISLEAWLSTCKKHQIVYHSLQIFYYCNLEQGPPLPGYYNADWESPSTSAQLHWSVTGLSMQAR